VEDEILEGYKLNVIRFMFFFWLVKPLHKPAV